VMAAQVTFDAGALARLCHERGVRRLSLFGSALRADFRADSDVDVLVEFEPGVRIGYLGLAGLEIELETVFGRKVDLNTPGGLHPRFRERALSEAEVLYAH